MKEKLFKDKKFLKEIAIILIVGIVVNACCFFMCSITGHCANDQQAYPVDSGYNSEITPFTVEQIINYCDNINTLPVYSDMGYVIFINNLENSSKPYAAYYNVLMWDRDYYDTVPFYINFSNGSNYFTFNFDSNGLETHFKIYQYLDWKGDFSDVNNKHYYNNSSLSNMNGTSPLMSAKTCYFASDNILLGNINNVDFPVVVVSNSNNATTTEFQDAELTGHALNNNQPTTPTITAPAIDSSLSVIENVKILFNWLGETIKSLLAWLLSSILSFFDNLVTNIKAFIDAVIRAINNGFKNVYNNIQSLFYPFITFLTAYAQGMQDFIDEITDSQTGIIPFLKTQLANIRQNIASMFDNMVTIQNWLVNMGNAMLHPYDEEQIQLYISRSTFVTSCRTLSTNLTSFVTNFFDVAEPQTLTFSLDFRNAYYNFGQCEISFDWLNPYKTPIRACLVGLLCLSVLNNLIEDLPSMFSGGGSHSKGTSK